MASPAQTGTIVRIPAPVLSAIEAGARAAQPAEACGLLIGRHAGEGFEITRHVPSANLAATPNLHFEIDPLLQLHWQKALRGTDETVIGHYHSHPKGPPAPSATDIAEAHDPALLWLITGLAPVHTRAFLVDRVRQKVIELTLEA